MTWLKGIVTSSRHPEVEAARPSDGRQSWRYRLFRAVSVSVLVFVSGELLAPVQAEAHDIKLDGNLSNDWIAGMTNSAGKSCCGNNDCRPVPVGSLTSALGGGLEVQIDGTRFPVPDGSIVPDISPDGRAWVCPNLMPALSGFRYTIQGVRCLLLPPSG